MAIIVVNIKSMSTLFDRFMSLLSDKELEELGVKTIGDRVVLRKRCRES